MNGTNTVWRRFSLVIGALALLLYPNQVLPQSSRVPPKAADRLERVQQAQSRAERNKADVVAWAHSRGISVRSSDGPRLREMVALRRGRPLIYTAQNLNAAISVGVDQVRFTAPFGVDGSGVTVGLWDGGTVMDNHQEFDGRIVLKDNAEDHYHATHVAGTMGASGVDPLALGMAPALGIDSYDWNFDEAEMVAAGAASAGEPGKIQLSNHSYGFLSGWFYAGFTNPWTRRSGYHWWGDIFSDTAEDLFGQYNEFTRAWDDVVYQSPYFLPFKAAGNERTDNPSAGRTVFYTPDGGTTWSNTVYDPALFVAGDGYYKGGYDTISAHGNAKNIMTVGAVVDAVLDGERAPSEADYALFSSWGPTDDGRIKPDVVANGTGVYSVYNKHPSAYISLSGTSMAAPNACGAAALLVDYYKHLFPGEAMRASTIKALMIHTADDLERPGPDYRYGWGLLNTRRAAELIQAYAQGARVRLHESVLTAASNSVEQIICHADGSEPVRVTLCWTDPPGPASWAHDERAPALVNDLDIRVIGPDGVHYPYSLDYTAPKELATANGKNYIDNVEQVYIEDPQPGIYTLVIDFEGALTDEQQHYSLITSGLTSDMDHDGLPDHWEGIYFGHSAAAIPSADSDGDGLDNLAEYIAGTDPTNAWSRFRIASLQPLVHSNGYMQVLQWNSLHGRLYNIYWTDDLIVTPFSPIATDIPGPLNVYTDSVHQAEDKGFYRIDARMQ